MEAIQTDTAGMDSAISRLEREVDLLREYRITLIADVVTGKLDVRESAQWLPEEAPPDIGAGETEARDEAESPNEEVEV